MSIVYLFLCYAQRDETHPFHGSRINVRACLGLYEDPSRAQAKFDALEAQDLHNGYEGPLYMHIEKAAFLKVKTPEGAARYVRVQPMERADAVEPHSAD
jgi:hypothetical protein